MADDEIIKELHKVKRSIAKKYGFSLEAMCEDLRKRQQESGHKVVSLRPKKIKGGKAAA